MDSFGGGWTLLRPDTIVEEATTVDNQTASATKVAVSRGVDRRGGASWDVVVVASGSCELPDSLPAFHWIKVADLDGWRQIMATYTFHGGATCWNLFGDTETQARGVPAMNIQPFEPISDFADRAENMSRTTDGAAIPYDGRTRYCAPGRDNFWHPDYKASPRTMRVVLRREIVSLPAGLAVVAHCGKPAWQLSDVFVR